MNDSQKKQVREAKNEILRKYLLKRSFLMNSNKKIRDNKRDKEPGPENSKRFIWEWENVGQLGKNNYWKTTIISGIVKNGIKV